LYEDTDGAADCGGGRGADNDDGLAVGVAEGVEAVEELPDDDGGNGGPLEVCEGDAAPRGLYEGGTTPTRRDLFV